VLTVYAQTDHNQHRAGAGAATGQGAGHMMNMPDEMKQRCRMMMQTEINPADPAAILALQDDLKLTPEQVQKLQAIGDKARQDAKAVLDEKQAKALQAVPATPQTPMAMHQHMMQMMQQTHAGQGGRTGAGGDGQMPMMNCPMMNMMGGAATQPAQDKPAGHEAHQ
jgi:hypothetical protein